MAPSIRVLTLRLPGAAPAEADCPHCGGSGIQRHHDCRYRTCLDCLGRGRRPPPAPDAPLLGRLSAVVAAAR